MNAPLSNNPPPPAGPLGPATFIVARATGEIEIRGASPDHLTHEQLKRHDYEFNDHQQYGNLWVVTGKKKAA